MAGYGEWNEKGATLSDATAKGSLENNFTCSTTRHLVAHGDSTDGLIV